MIVRSNVWDLFPPLLTITDLLQYTVNLDIEIPTLDHELGIGEPELILQLEFIFKVMGEKENEYIIYTNCSGIGFCYVFSMYSFMVSSAN